MNSSQQTKKLRTIALIIVVILIMSTIWYLESKKPHYEAGAIHDISSSDIAANQAAESASSTSAVAMTPNSPTPKILVDRSAIIAAKKQQYPMSREFVDPTGFINSQPFKLSDLVGKKVILLDFWTYSCINCQRTLPYLNAWYQKYKDQGLVIIGVHTPEFDFEKNINNVQAAVNQLGVKYPVVLDSNMGTWNAYQNLYWPREYLIDIDGFIVHDKIGEGDYDVTEKAIQQALEERQTVLGLHQTINTSITTPSDVITMDPSKVQTQETYLGSNRSQPNGSLLLSGTWNYLPEYAESTSPTAKIEYQYVAKNVYFVASAKTSVKAKIYRDGVLLTGSERGSDVAADGTVTFSQNRLYTLINGSDYGQHTITIEIENPGLDAYTFTFG